MSPIICDFFHVRQLVQSVKASLIIEQGDTKGYDSHVTTVKYTLNDSICILTLWNNHIFILMCLVGGGEADDMCTATWAKIPAPQNKLGSSLTVAFHMTM